MPWIQVLWYMSEVWIRIEARSDVIHILNLYVNLTTGVLHGFSQIRSLSDPDKATR